MTAVTDPAQRAPRYAPPMPTSEALAAAVAEQAGMDELMTQWHARKRRRNHHIWVAADKDAATRRELEQAFEERLSWSAIRGIIKEQAAFARGRAERTDNDDNGSTL